MSTLNWMRIDLAVPEHPKVRKLAARLGVGEVTALGHLTCMWAWAMKFATTGDLSSHDHEDIAIGARWSEEPDKFIRGMVAAKLIDETPDGLAIHDWDEYNGKAIELHESRRAAGKKGAVARWGGESPPNSSANGTTNGKAIAHPMAPDSTNVRTNATNVRTGSPSDPKKVAASLGRSRARVELGLDEAEVSEHIRAELQSACGEVDEGAVAHGLEAWRSEKAKAAL